MARKDSVLLYNKYITKPQVFLEDVGEWTNYKFYDKRPFILVTELKKMGKGIKNRRINRFE